MSQVPDQDKILEAATMRRVSWRLMPFLMLAYLLCYIDRHRKIRGQPAYSGW